MTSHSTPDRVPRYSATVTWVTHRDMPADKRQDTEIVRAGLDYADGAMWWVEDAGKVKAGDRYQITVERLATRS